MFLVAVSRGDDSAVADDTESSGTLNVGTGPDTTVGVSADPKRWTEVLTMEGGALTGVTTGVLEAL